MTEGEKLELCRQIDERERAWKKEQEAQRTREIWERTGWCSKASPVEKSQPHPGSWLESNFPEDTTLGQVLQLTTDSILLMGSRKVKRVMVEFYE